MKNLDPKSSKQGKIKVCSKALHPEFSYPLIDIAEMSIEKGYEPLNWLDPKNGVTALYLIEAAQRHLDKVKLGIDINTEEKKLDGTATSIQPYHAAQVAYNMLMLVLQIKKGVVIDDRVFKQGEVISIDKEEQYYKAPSMKHVQELGMEWEPINKQANQYGAPIGYYKIINSKITHFPGCYCIECKHNIEE